MKKSNLSEQEKVQLKFALEELKGKFEKLMRYPGKEVMDSLIARGINPVNAAKIARMLRKGEPLTPGFEALLSMKGITIESLEVRHV